MEEFIRVALAGALASREIPDTDANDMYSTFALAGIGANRMQAIYFGKDRRK